MYLMTCTRPDLAYPLSILARYVAPGRHRPEHMAAAKRVLRYLCSTSGLGLVLGGRSPVVLTGHADASWVDDLATQWSSKGYTFSLGSGSFSWRSTRSSSVLSSSCEAEIYAGAMAAQELRWLTYLLTDLGEPPRSSIVLYVDNKAMLALCREHRLEHRTKHIALRYFLARELQQRGQLRLAYMASEANTADIFTKALQPCDHQRFCTMIGLILLTIATAKHLPLRQIDVKNAFLYALVDATIFVEQSHTYGEGDPRGIGFKQLPHDSEMYCLHFNIDYIVLTIYANDLLYTGTCNKLVNQFKENLAQHVDITINHNVTHFLGLNITYAPETIHLSAFKYAEQLGECFKILPAPL
ncbi:unnamed protein product [Closterium sp. NIES-53]